MKSVYIILLLLQISLSSVAGITGVGGGSTIGNSQIGQYVTVEVCDSEYSKTCRKVTYKVRPTSPETLPQPCSHLEVDNNPCFNQNPKIPLWLQKLNTIFENSETEKSIEVKTDNR